MDLSQIRTPSAILDLERLDRNLARMRSRASDLGVQLRPHMKTGKSVDVALRAVSTGEGITVSTLAEAEHFADAGFADILYAVGMAASKLERAAALSKRGVDLQVVVDHPLIAEAVAARSRLRAWIEVDCDGRRSGVQPDDANLTTIADKLGERLAGVMTHCGGSYGSADVADRLRWAHRERDAVVNAASRLRQAGHECRGVSVGSTPTATVIDDLDVVTEMRPGVYMFMDVFQAGLGVCDLADVALSVAATVIGTTSDGVVIDAGALALSLDRSTAGRDFDAGFGLVADAAGKVLPGIRVDRVTQEHGVIATHQGSDAIAIGDVVRILPNHACMTAAAHDRYEVVVGREVVDAWARVNGW